MRYLIVLFLFGCQQFTGQVTVTEVTDESQVNQMQVNIESAADSKKEFLNYFWVDRVHNDFPEFKRYVDPEGRAARIDDIKQQFDPKDPEGRISRRNAINKFKLLGAELFYSRTLRQSVAITRFYQKPDSKFTALAALDRTESKGYIYINDTVMTQHLNELRNKYDEVVIVK